MPEICAGELFRASITIIGYPGDQFTEFLQNMIDRRVWRHSEKHHNPLPGGWIESRQNHSTTSAQTFRVPTALKLEG